MTEMKRLEGQVAIVTGGASGFGAAIATRFLREGCNVMIGDLNEAGAQALVDETRGGKNVHVLKMNVSEVGDWQKAVDLCKSAWGRLDHIVNNAGTSYTNKPTLEVEAVDFDRCFNVNVKSVFWSVKIAAPLIIEGGRGGSIINISSIGSVRPRAGLVWYNSSKGAVTNATKGLAAEFGHHQVRVNAIAPLLSGTGLFSTFTGVEDTSENREKFTSNVPLGRLTDPMDVANTALFLASDEGKFITGVNLEVDGGRGI